MPKNRLNSISIFKKFSYTFVSNILSLCLSSVLFLVIPKFIDIKAFGYYQLYLLYINYAWGLSFGWCEGIYLRLGGKYYEDMDKPVYSTQFRLLGLMEIVLCVCIFICSLLVVKDPDKHFVIGCTCFVAIGVCLRLFISYILQSTDRIKEYAIVTISERIMFLLLAMALMMFGYRGYKLLLVSDAFSKNVSLGIGIFYCRDIVFSPKIVSVKRVIPEIKDNMSAGIKLLLAAMSSLLITGVVRFSVEHHWGVSTFGKVSLTLSISNMGVTAINAIGTVMYPVLCRTEQEKMPNIYKLLRMILMGLVFGVLILYYPAQKALNAWLPQYADSLRYAAVLLPICVYESKVSILVNTYLNTLRMEKLLMKCNLAALSLSVICTAVSTIVLNSVTGAIYSVLIVLIFRCVLSEIALSTKLPIHVAKDIELELIMTVAFIICNWYFGFSGMLMYAGCYVLYLVIKRQDIKETLNFIKSMG